MNGTCQQDQDTHLIHTLILAGYLGAVSSYDIFLNYDVDKHPCAKIDATSNATNMKTLKAVADLRGGRV